MKSGEISKKFLIAATKKGVAKAASETKKVMGYNVIKKGGWIVKAFNDGRVEKIKRIEIADSKKHKIIMD